MAIATHEPTIGAVDLVVPYVPRLLIDWLRDTPDQRYRCRRGDARVRRHLRLHQADRAPRAQGQGRRGGDERHARTAASASCSRSPTTTAQGSSSGAATQSSCSSRGRTTPRAPVAAAFEMQRAIRTVGRLKTTAGLVTLRMSVGIHSGAFDFFLVGDLHRELVISGPAATECVDDGADRRSGRDRHQPDDGVACSIRRCSARPRTRRSC